MTVHASGNPEIITTAVDGSRFIIQHFCMFLNVYVGKRVNSGAFPRPATFISILHCRIFQRSLLSLPFVLYFSSPRYYIFVLCALFTVVASTPDIPSFLFSRGVFWKDFFVNKIIGVVSRSMFHSFSVLIS